MRRCRTQNAFGTFAASLYSLLNGSSAADMAQLVYDDCWWSPPMPLTRRCLQLLGPAMLRSSWSDLRTTGEHRGTFARGRNMEQRAQKAHVLLRADTTVRRCALDAWPKFSHARPTTTATHSVPGLPAPLQFAE